MAGAAFLALLLFADQALPVIVRRRPADLPSPEVAAEPVAPSEPAEPAALPPISRRSLLGEWRLGLARGGQSCVVRLHDIGIGFGFYSLSQSANCPEGLFSAIRWRADEQGLSLANRQGKVLARLKIQDDGSLQGRRVADGAALVMGRIRDIPMTGGSRQ